MERNALKIAMAVNNIVKEVRCYDSSDLAQRMIGAFGWWTFAEDHLDMTAEEIASAAADGFAVEV